jgi:CubicO group peptidase (beta-lactamase class C family)
MAFLLLLKELTSKKIFYSMKKLFSIALVLLSISVYAQPLTSKAIDELTERSMKAFDVPGIAVAVIKDGKVIHSKGYGVRSLNTMQKVDENTLFGIASNSKAFTAATLGILVDEGKIKWDDKVRDYIPEFKLYSPFVTEEFTIRDLLTHRSGLGLGAGDLMFFPDSSDFTLKDVIYNLRFLKSTSSFRSKFDYDNNLYIVAGEVVARVTGKSWDEFVEQRIIQPLGMTKTAASFDRLKDNSNVIDGHAAVEGKVKVIARSTIKVGHSAGGLNSNIADLSKWVLLQLNHGKFGDNLSKKLFSEDVHEEMWTPQTIIPVRNPGPYNVHFASYGLGFGLSDVKGYKQVSHTGGLEGMVTQITMIPELNLGIIVLTNQQEGGAFSSITNQIKDAYFGIANTDRVKEYSANRGKALSSAKHLTDSIWSEIDAVRKAGVKFDLNAITGTYTDAWFGEVTISIKNGKLRFDSKRSPKLTGEMFAYKGSTFVVKWKDRSMDADAYVSFTLDETGKGAGITMKPISPLTDFSYDFQDLNFKRVK